MGTMFTYVSSMLVDLVIRMEACSFVVTCAAHGGVPFSFACKSCHDMPLCYTCASDHATHDVDGLDDVASTYRLQLSTARDTLQFHLDDARKSAVILDDASVAIRGSAARVLAALEAWRASLPAEDSTTAEVAIASLADTLTVVQAGKIAAVETEQVSVDSGIEAGDGALASISALLESATPSAAVVLGFRAVHDRIAAATASLAALPRAEDTPISDTTLEVAVEGCSLASLPELVTEMLRPVPLDTLAPGLLVLTHWQRGSKGGRRAMVLECADPGHIFLVVEAKRGEGPSLEEAAAGVADIPRFPHPSSSSYSGCGGNPTGRAHCAGSGNCRGRIACSDEGCGAGARYTCCGAQGRGSTECLLGITEEQAKANVKALWTMHDMMRCDAVPGVHFPAAAYHPQLEAIAPPVTYGGRAVVSLETLALVPKTWRRQA